jgi:hypothetical protein
MVEQPHTREMMGKAGHAKAMDRGSGVYGQKFEDLIVEVLG